MDTILQHVNLDDILPEHKEMLLKSGVDLDSHRENLWVKTDSKIYYFFDTWRIVIFFLGASRYHPEKYITVYYYHYTQLSSLILKVDKISKMFSLSFDTPSKDDRVLRFIDDDGEKVMSYFNMISDVQRQMGIYIRPLTIVNT